MLISSRRKFVFFHTPKVAGSSITRALRPFSDYPIERVYNYMIDYLGSMPMLNLYPMHISPAELRKKMRHKSNFDKYFKFAFVRNTWDWHVSQFNFHKHKPGTAYHDTFRSFTFEDYVRWAVIPENLAHARSNQKKFLSDRDGKLLVDFIGRMETIEADFNEICNRLGVNVLLPKKNQSKRIKKYQEYYTSETKELIARAHAEDIDYFDFSFE